MSHTEKLPANPRWWLETLVWSLGFAIATGVACYVNETAREIVGQGLAYLFMFMTTPFILESSAAVIGLCIVIFINNRRIEREGDGWVMMEVKQPEAEPDDKAGEDETPS